MSSIETIQLTEHSRIVVEVDEDAENPRGDWAMLTGFVKIRDRGDSRLINVAAVHADPIEIERAMNHFEHRHPWTPYTDIMYRRREEAEDLVIRWAKIFHDMHLEYDHEHGGFWFVDPKEMRENWGGPDYPEGRTKAEQEALVIEQEQKIYRQWSEGEVYGVILEHAVLWQKVDEQGNPLDTPSRIEWEEVASLWGCYLDDTYTAADVVGEFELTDEEEEAIQPLLTKDSVTERTAS